MPNQRPKARPWHLINQKYDHVEPSVQKARLQVCMECPKYISSVKVCRECGCFMPAKTLLAIAECPIGKWEAEETPPPA